jgi:hypothetical protein
MAGTKAARKVDILGGKIPQRTGIGLYAAIEREVTMLTASLEIDVCRGKRTSPLIEETCVW